MTKINLAPQQVPVDAYDPEKDTLFRRKILKSVKVIDGQLQSAILSIQPDAITATVMSTTAWSNFANSKENTIKYSATEPSPKSTGMLWMDTSQTPKVLKRYNGTAWEATAYNLSEIEQTAETISLGVFSSEIVPYDSRLDTAEATILVQAEQIATKVSTTDLTNALTNYSTITQTADEITLSFQRRSNGIIPMNISLWEQGTMDSTSTGALGASTLRVRLINPVEVTPSKNYYFTLGGSLECDFAYAFYTEAMAFISGSSGWVTLKATKVTTPSNAKYVRIVMRKDTDATFTTAELANVTFGMTDAFIMSGANYSFDSDKARFYSDGQEWYDDSGVLQVYFDTVNHRYVFKGRIESSSGLIAGWSIGTSTISKGVVKLDSANERIYLNTSEYFYAGGSGRIGIVGAFYTRAVYPQADNTYDLGLSTNRWATIWCNDASLNGSDIRLKKDVSTIDKGVELILNLKPVQYRWKAKEKGRYHYGLIAQEVKKTLDKLNIDSGLYVDPTIKPDWDRNDPEQENVEHTLALRYGELIAPLIQTVQYLNQRIEDLESRLS